MRLHRWFNPLLGALAAIAGADSASAQQPPVPMSGSAAIDPYCEYPLPQAAAYPSYYQPWPAISPYEMNYGQHTNEGGLWQYENLLQSGTLKWKFRTEYVRTRSEKFHGYIGNKQAPTYRQQILDIIREDPYDLPELADAFESDGVNPGFNYFDPVDSGLFENPHMNGVRLTLEGINQDGSGLDFWGLINDDAQATFDARTNDAHPSRGGIPDLIEFENLLRIIQARAPQLLLGGPIDVEDIPGQIGQFDDVIQALQATVLNLRGIPLDDGTIRTLPGGLTIGGASAVYDLNFRIRLDTENRATGLRWHTSPLIRTKNFRLNSTAGLRYMYLQEQFGFVGQHSGLIYDNLDNEPPNPDVLIHSLPNFFDDDGDGVIDNAGLVEDQFQGGGGGGAATDVRFFYAGNPAIYPITSLLYNTVYSHMAGPELGLDYVLGSERFRIGGRTQVGILINHERVRMSGDNIFVTTRESNINIPNAQDARPNDFTDSENHTHASPMFEQNVYVEGQFFRYFPILRRVHAFQNADLRLGYTFTAITEVIRPDESILWRANPAQNIFPEIDARRSTWRMSSFDIGVTWKW